MAGTGKVNENCLSCQPTQAELAIEAVVELFVGSEMRHELPKN